MCKTKTCSSICIPQGPDPEGSSKQEHHPEKSIFRQVDGGSFSPAVAILFGMIGILYRAATKNVNANLGP